MISAELQKKLDKYLSEADTDGVKKICVGVGVWKEDRLMIVRRLPDDFLGGYWELPGGGVDGEEDPIESVIRETKEETGLTVTQISDVRFGFDYRDELQNLTRQLNFNVIVSQTDSLHLTEHDSYQFISLKDVEKIFLTNEMKKSILDLFQARSDSRLIFINPIF